MAVKRIKTIENDKYTRTPRNPIAPDLATATAATDSSMKSGPLVTLREESLRRTKRFLQQGTKPCPVAKNGVAPSSS